MTNCTKQADIAFGNRRLSEFHAKILSDVVIAPIPADTEVFVGVGRSTQQIIKNRRTAARDMTMLIDFFGGEAEARRHESEFQTLFLGNAPVLVDIGDGYLYDCVLVASAQTQGIDGVLLSMEYRFSAVRRGPARSVEITTLDRFNYMCESTFPKTDCRVTLYGLEAQQGDDVYVDINDKRFTFDMDYRGIVVIDGINKIITIEGDNWTNLVGWTDFPYLVPGNNVIRAVINGVAPVIPAKVEYIPVYM